MGVIDTLVITESDVELWISRLPAGDWLSPATHEAVASALSAHRQYGANDRRAVDARMLAEQHIQNDLDYTLPQVVTLWYYRWEEYGEAFQSSPNDLVNRVMYGLLNELSNLQSPTRTSTVIKWVSTLQAIREALPHDKRVGFEAVLSLVMATAEEEGEGIDEALVELAEPLAALRALYERPKHSSSNQDPNFMSLNDINITEVDVTLWKNPRSYDVVVKGVKHPLTFKERVPATMTESQEDAFVASSLTSQLDVLMGIARPTTEEREQLTRARHILKTGLVKCLEVWVPRALLTFKHWVQEEWAPITPNGALVKWVRELDAAYHDPKMRGRTSTLTNAAGAIVDLHRLLVDSRLNQKVKVKGNARWIAIFQEAKQYQAVEDKEGWLDRLFEEVSELLEDQPSGSGGYQEVKTVEIDPGVLAAIQWFWYWSNQSEGKSEQEIEYYSGVLQYCSECTLETMPEPPEGLTEGIEFLLDRISSIVETFGPRAKKYVNKKLAQHRKFTLPQLCVRSRQYESLKKDEWNLEEIVRKAAGLAAENALDEANDKVSKSVNKEPAPMNTPSLTIREFVGKLGEAVYGNQRVKEAMAVCIRYRYLMKNVKSTKVQLHPTNLLISGGTGSGKTELIKALGKTLDIPVISVVATSFSETGYVGGDLSEIIEQLNEMISARASKGKAQDSGSEQLDQLIGRMLRERKRESSASRNDILAYKRTHPVLAIVFIDEIDKLIETGESKDRVSRMGVQRSLLGMISGMPIDRRDLLNTADVLWISAGAFSVSPMTKLLPELLGRFNIRVSTDPVTADNMEQVLNNPCMSSAHSWVEVLKQDGVTVKLEKSGLRAMAELADARNQKYGNLGMRQLPTIATEIFQPLMLNPPTEKVVFDAEYVRTHHPV